MADKSNGWQFNRGLDENFMEKLESLAKQSSWFAEVLADPGLILGIRNNYLNVYWHGQSLFKIERTGKTGSLKFSTHPKYLLNPDLSKAVPFDGASFKVGDHALAKEYGPNTLARMKRAAKLYSGGEKDGVHAVVHANSNVIDLEVAFNGEAAEDDDEPLTPRIDLACFDEVKGKIRLCFWEAKLYGNKELRAHGETEAPVVEQVRGYGKQIKKHRETIVDSYRRVAQNLVTIASWGVTPREVGKLVARVANDEAVVIDDPPFVGLIVYGFDAADKESKSWNTHIGKLKKVAGMPIRSAGQAKHIKLRGTDSD